MRRRSACRFWRRADGKGGDGMMRLINIVLVGTMLSGAGVVYYMKYEAERSANTLQRMYRSVATEREAIATLNAEWSMLNQPRRLQEFAERYHSYLELDRLDPNQIAGIDDIPMRNRETADPGRSIAQIIANTKTGDLTGTIRRPTPKSADKVLDKAGKPVVKTVEPRANDPLARMIPNPDWNR
jgi:hypothetical protein